MSPTLQRCLEDLATRIDEAQEQNNRRQWAEFALARCKTDIFVAAPRRPKPSRIEWPKIHINTAQNDYEAMVISELGGVCGALNGGSQRLNVRCNYGTGIMPCLFGAELFMMPEQTNTLPTAIPMGTAAVPGLLDKGVPDVNTALGAKVFRCAELFQEAFSKYPILGRNIEIYHPDVQGPIDVAEVVWGSEIFYGFGDDPDLMRRFLDLVTQTYAAFMRKWYALVPPLDEQVSAHWALAHKGRLMIRNDSLMNLSPGIYVEFVLPLDQRLFDEFGGGAIHFCGRGEHFIEAMSQMRGLHGINLSQPHLNDMQKVYRNTIDKGIPMLGLDTGAAKAAGRPMRGLAHCWA